MRRPLARPDGSTASLAYHSWSTAGAPTSTTYGNGVTETLGFDGWQRPTTSVVTDASGSVVDQRTVRWNVLDQVARDLQSPGSPVVAQMAERFGAQILCDDGSLDRQFDPEDARRFVETFESLKAGR